MMISPEMFVEDVLKGKTREEALKEVGSLRQEIKDLEKAIYEDLEPEELMICPSPQVRIDMDYDYLLAARKYFLLMGWEYALSEEEKADEDFNGKICDIKSIEFRIGGYFGGSRVRTVTFDGDKVTDSFEVFRRIKSPDEEESDLSKFTRQEFLDILSECHMGRWKESYMDSNILDGTSWDVVITYDNGKTWKSGGCNAYPYNFQGFLEAMEIEDEL